MRFKAAPAALALLLSVYYICGGKLFASLLIAVILHESGHAVAMLLCGARLRELRFDVGGLSMSGTGLPGFWEELFALAAGPLVGLLPLLLTDGELARISLALTLFNLLPALPLDGGRLLRLIGANDKALSVSGIVCGAGLCLTGLGTKRLAFVSAGVCLLLMQVKIDKNAYWNYNNSNKEKEAAMLQEAVITKIRDDGLAEVVVERMGICGGDCEGCHECQYENLMKSVVQNPIGAHRGQHVYIETPTSGVFKGALAIYVIPLIMLFVGYGIGALLGFGEGLCMLFAFAALAASYFIVSAISKKLHAKNPTPTQIVDIIYDQD